MKLIRCGPANSGRRRYSFTNRLSDYMYGMTCQTVELIEQFFRLEKRFSFHRIKVHLIFLSELLN